MAGKRREDRPGPRPWGWVSAPEVGRGRGAGAAGPGVDRGHPAPGEPARGGGPAARLQVAGEAPQVA